MIQQDGQMRERRTMAQARLDRVEVRNLQAANQVGVGAHQHAAIVAAEPASTEVDPAETSTSTVLNSTDVALAIGQALSACGLNNKQACAWMDIDPGLWSRQLQGEGHISFQRLLKLPIAFWTEFVPRLGEPIGLVVSAEDAADRAMLQAAAAVDLLVRSAVLMRRSARRTA